MYFLHSQKFNTKENSKDIGVLVQNNKPVWVFLSPFLYLSVQM